MKQNLYVYVFLYITNNHNNKNNPLRIKTTLKLVIKLNKVPTPRESESFHSYTIFFANDTIII